MRIFIVFSILAASFLVFAKADADDIPDISEMSIDEIEKLPPEIITQLPALDIFAKVAEEKQFSRRFFDTALIINLSKLLFFEPSEEQILQAVKSFQKSIGNKPDGVLTMGQFEELSRRVTRSTDTPVYPPTFGEDIRIYIESDFALAEGTWTIEGQKIAYPINHSKISCRKHNRVCEVVQVDVAVPNLDQKSESYSLHLSTENCEVISWKTDEVVSQSVGECRKTLMTMSKSSGEVFQVTSNVGKAGCDVGGLLALPRLETPRIAKLVGGLDRAREFWQERKMEISKFYGANLFDELELEQTTNNPPVTDQKN